LQRNESYQRNGEISALYHGRNGVMAYGMAALIISW